ncbi:nuclear transport factor 2 family protein [Microbacter sp. GSS18]|nr:nuclear transport factor 2 family protein [Microbacter sp. GSS18]
MSTTAVDEVEQLIAEWSDAYRARDIDALLRTAIGDDLQLVGTGADEVRFGLDEFRTQALRDFSQADEAAFTFTNMRVTTVGDAAFAYCDVAVAGSAGGQSFEMSGLRMTAGLVRTDDGWRFVQTHLSAPDSAQADGQSFEG